MEVYNETSGVVYDTVGEGAVLGESGLILGTKRTASCRCTQVTMCKLLTKNDFEEVCQSFPEERMAIFRTAHNQTTKRAKHHEKVERNAKSGSMEPVPKEDTEDYNDSSLEPKKKQVVRLDTAAAGIQGFQTLIKLQKNAGGPKPDNRARVPNRAQGKDSASDSDSDSEAEGSSGRGGGKGPTNQEISARLYGIMEHLDSTMKGGNNIDQATATKLFERMDRLESKVEGLNTQLFERLDQLAAAIKPPAAT